MLADDLTNSLGNERLLAGSEVLFRAGDQGDEVYFVVEGSLEVVHQSEQGDVVVGSLAAGDVVGEITAVVGGRRTATVRAASGPVRLRCVCLQPRR